MSKKRKSFIVPVMLLLFITLVSFAIFNKGEEAIISTGGLDKQEVVALIEKTINENPELIIKSLENFQKKSEEVAFNRVKEQIKTSRPEYERDPNDAKIGSDSAKIKIVHFLDYSCGYCKRMSSINDKIIDENGDVQFIFKQLPVLGEQSILKAKAAMAVNRVDKAKFYKYHQLLNDYNGEVTIDALVELAGSAGVNKDDLKQTITSDAMHSALENNMRLAQKLGINGTPVYIINGEFIPGAISYDHFSDKLRHIRKNLS